MRREGAPGPGSREAVISAVDETNLLAAATVHSVSWRASHRAFCSPAFVEQHSPERQRAYLREKLESGSRIYLLSDPEPVGLVSVTGSLIADLYVLPEEQGRGYGTRLALFAMGACTGVPTLWLLENNARAERLYRRLGFRETGRVRENPGGLSELELALG